MTMNAVVDFPVSSVALDKRYGKTIEVSKRVRWDIDRDVIRGRQFDFDKKFLPDGLSMVRDLYFLTPAQQVFMSQIQGRTYANMFALVRPWIWLMKTCWAGV